MSSKLFKNLVINAYKKQVENELKKRSKKKGILIKLLNANSKRSSKLVEILKETEHQNVNTHTGTTAQKSDEEFLKRYSQMGKGGPKHSIAVSRAHHLTNFLSEYLVNAFQSGHFLMPDLPDDLESNEDLNGYVKDKFSFEISGVELPADLNRLKIYWLASTNEKINIEIEKYLEKSLKNQIRSMLTNERVMSYVPEVEFIRDNSKMLLDKLDEYLLKVKLDLNNEQNETDQSNSAHSATKTQPKPVNKVDNIFGVDFNRLVESIKKNSDYEPWTNDSSSSAIQLANEPTEVTIADATNSKVDKANFEMSLKAFQINQRMKRERLNKSAILKLETLEYHASLDTHTS